MCIQMVERKTQYLELIVYGVVIVWLSSDRTGFPFCVTYSEYKKKGDTIEILTCMASMLLGTSSLYCLMVKCHVFILMRSSKVNSKISLPSVHTWE